MLSMIDFLPIFIVHTFLSIWLFSILILPNDVGYEAKLSVTLKYLVVMWVHTSHNICVIEFLFFMPTISNIFLFLYVDYLNKRMLLALCNPPTSRDVTLYAFCHVLYDCFKNMSGCVSKGIIICVAVIVANKKRWYKSKCHVWSHVVYRFLCSCCRTNNTLIINVSYSQFHI